MRRYSAFLSLLLVFSAAFAGTDPSNTLRLGDGTAADKKIILHRGSNNPVIKWNESLSTLQFSNDGSTFRDIGSGAGGGGGISVIGDKNADFEAGSGNWTASGGSFTIDSSTQLFDRKSGVFNASAGSQTLSNTAVAIPEGLKGANGFASCYFKTTATDYKIQVTDGTNVLTERTIPALSAAQEIGTAFVFPSSGNVQLRVISASDAADLGLDNCYLGTMKQGPVSQASEYGSLTYAAAANCAWSVTNNGSYGNFSADSDCATPTATGSASAPGTKIPGVTFASLPPGVYVVHVDASLKASGSTAQCAYALSDGTTAQKMNQSTDAASEQDRTSGGGSFRFEYSTAQSNVTFQLQAISASANSTCTVSANSGGVGSPDFRMSVQRFPSAQEQAFRPDQVAWKVDANISGANPDLGASDQASYVPISNSGLTLTQNAGSIAAEIPCASGTASTGTTCSGVDEHVGVAFNAPTAGNVLACASFSHTLVNSAGTIIDAYFQIAETSNTAITILSEGKSRVGSSNSIASSTIVHPLRVCGTFSFASAGKKTLRLMYEQENTGTPSSNLILADAASTHGQRDIHWEVYPISQAIPAPLLVGSVTSNSSGLERVERASIANNGTCSITSQSGTWISSVSHPGTGQCVLNFTAGIWSAGASCVATQRSSVSNGICRLNSTSPSNSTINIVCLNSSFVAADYDFDVICMGPR